MVKETADLGLPIEYQKLPQFFDAHNINADTANKNAVIEALLKNIMCVVFMILLAAPGLRRFI